MISQGLSQLPVKPLWWSTIEHSAADSSTCGCSNAMTLLYSWRCVVRMSSLVEPGRSRLVSRDSWGYRFTSFHVAVHIEVSTPIFVRRSVLASSVFTVIKCFSCSNKWYGTVSASPFPLVGGGEAALHCCVIKFLFFASEALTVPSQVDVVAVLVSIVLRGTNSALRSFADYVPTCTYMYSCIHVQFAWSGTRVI